MAYRRRRLYIPITRSGSSILASILTQLIDEGRRRRQEEIQARMSRGEISPRSAFLRMHPVLSFLAVMFLMWIAVSILLAIVGR